jgi:pyridoxal phosphate enzyme (YggS family)
VHGVDSFKLLKEVNKQAKKVNRAIDILLQVHIAAEETKFGLDEKELNEIMTSKELSELKNVNIRGLMGMASFTDDREKVREEFGYLKSLFGKYSKSGISNSKFEILSMGMSDDYEVAIEEGSTMARIGSLIFGERPRN